jgi:ribosomal protein S18 acetylase RimI-like enzyme
MSGRVGSYVDYLEYEVRHDGTAEIVDIAVRSEREKGVGRSMFQSMLDLLPPEVHLVWALCRDENAVGNAFYRGVGFRKLCELPGFYKDSDAVMWGYDVEKT